MAITKKLSGLIAAATLLVFSPLAFASVPVTSSESTASVKTTLGEIDTTGLKPKVERAFPDLRIDSVRATPVEGLFEVVSGPTIFYVNTDVTYALQGDLSNIATHKNLTKARFDEISRVPFTKLPLTQAIKFVKGDGSRVIATFEDPNCPYCARLHESLMNVTNVTVYTFIAPILSPDSNIKAKNILCAKDAASTWNRWMLDKVVPPNAPDCVRPDADNVRLFMKIGASGTPTIFFTDGTRRAGYLPPDQLEKMIENHSSKKDSAPFVKSAAFVGGQNG